MAEPSEAAAEIERLKQLLDTAQEYLVELKGEWAWRKDEPRDRTRERYDRLELFIKQLAKATNQSEGGDA